MKKATHNILLSMSMVLFATCWSACPDTSTIRDARYACTTNTNCSDGYVCHCNVCVQPGNSSSCPEGDLGIDSSSLPEVLTDADGQTEVDAGEQTEVDAGGQTEVDCFQLNLAHGGHDYRICWTALNHTEATKVCEGFESDLFLPETVDERSVIYGALSNHPKTANENLKDLWLGISIEDALSICDKDCDAVTEPIPLTWAENEPGEEGSCIRHRKTLSGWEWAVEGCDDKAFPFLCETREDFNACNVEDTDLFPCVAPKVNCAQVTIGSTDGYRCCEPKSWWDDEDNVCKGCGDSPCAVNEECIEIKNGYECQCAQGFVESGDGECVPEQPSCTKDQFDTGSACVLLTDIQTDCQMIATSGKTNPFFWEEGYFPIDPNGTNQSPDPFMVWCEIGSSDDGENAGGWTQIAHNTGTAVYGSEVYGEGYGLNDNKPPTTLPFKDYVIPCQAFHPLYEDDNAYIVVRVTISDGDDEKTVVQDYFQPKTKTNEEIEPPPPMMPLLSSMKQWSLCEMLTHNNRHEWWYPGSDAQESKWMKPEVAIGDPYEHGLGGSPADWPKKWDDRKYLNFWGSNEVPGGCCMDPNNDWQATTTVAIKVFTTDKPDAIVPTQ